MSTTYISPPLRRAVIERAGDCCEYCRISQPDQFFAFEIDHIIAEKHGGQTQLNNLCLSCPDCNAFKGSDIASLDWENAGALTGLFNPHEESWEAHFRINASSGRIEPQTATGRVTVFLLRLNDSDRMADRKLLIEAGRYPCAGDS
ncbi:MAG: HNH endonuclease [Anaerolineae bacterium]|nr:HNH endonuclease [Anaerolineae bacterium]